VKVKSLIRLVPATRNYVILRGGLGNQLHQIAACVALSERNSGVPRIFAHIVDHAEDPTRRGFFRQVDLQGLFPGANLKEVNFLENLILVILSKFNFIFCKKLISSEQNFDSFTDKKSIVFLKGWFQSSEFFPWCMKPEVLSGSDVEFAQNLTIHVRLTDFASIDSDPLNSKYYRNAISLMPGEVKTNPTICFSDDIAGARTILQGIPHLKFPEIDQVLNPAELLKRLSSTNFLIASKSSLCNWASYAVIKNGGYVVTPLVERPIEGKWLSSSN
jgi:hypothetical protein